MQDGRWRASEEGTPQGGNVSPLLANLYLHKVLDDWFAKEVKPRLKGNSGMVRYADDAVLYFDRKEDAERVMKVLHQRLEKFAAFDGKQFGSIGFLEFYTIDRDLIHPCNRIVAFGNE